MSEDSWDSWAYNPEAFKQPEETTQTPDIDEELEVVKQSKTDNVAMSKVSKGLPLEIQMMIIDYLAPETFEEMYVEDEYDIISRDPRVVLQTARMKSWANYLAVGGYFSNQMLRRLIKWEWWGFDDYTVFSRTLRTWEIISPGSWNQVRNLTLGKIRLDESNWLEIVDILPRVSMFTNLTSFRVTFEAGEPYPGFCEMSEHYFDQNEDLDETHPELFEALEAVRLPGIWVYIGFLKNTTMKGYLTSVIDGTTAPVTRQPDVIPYWRREPVVPWVVGTW